MDRQNVLYDEYAVSSAIISLAETIDDHYGCKEPFIMLCILKGGAYLTSSLLNLLPTKRNIRVEFIRCSNDLVSQPLYQYPTAGASKLYPIVKEQKVLIVDDICDTGKTIRSIASLLKQLDAKSVKSCVLLDKPFKRDSNALGPDYVGITMTEDHWVYGCGLDNNEYERNLPFIYFSLGRKND